MTHIRSWRAMFVSLLMLALLLLSSAFGLWRNGNLAFSDWLFNAGGITVEADPQVLLVTLPDAAASESVLSALSTELNRLGARQVVAMPGPAQVVADAPGELMPTRFVGPAGAGQGAGRAEPGSETPVAWVVPPVFDAGYFRTVPISHRLSTIDEVAQAAPWFVAVAGPGRPVSSPVQLNFGLLANGLPTVSQAQVLAGEVIEELVQDRVVILGSADRWSTPGYPVPGRGQPLSQLEMQGLTWATVATDTGLQSLALPWLVLLVTAIFLLNLFVFQWLSAAYGALYSMAAIAIFALSGWGALQFFQVIPPVVDCSVAQLASLLFVYQARRHSEAQTVQEVLGASHSALFERYVPEAFNETDSPWPKLVVFINQQLNLNRSILLERVPGDHRVREIQALNCSIDDIVEQRRDYERAPYSDALQHRGPLHLRRAFFDRGGEGELEFLTPLIYAGEVLGFWALAVAPAEDWSQEAFENNIASFASQISELLYHRQQLAREKSRRQRLSYRLLALEVGRKPHEQLRSAQELLGNRQVSLEAMFDSLNAGAILYDLFGQVLQANAKALEIAGQAELSIYRLTALDFLCGLCDISQDDARRELRHVTLKRAEVRLPVRAVKGYQGLLLSIRPVSHANTDLETIRTSSPATPFKLLGLSFELTDTSDTRKVLGLRDDLLQQLFLNLRNRLSRATLAARLAASEVNSSSSGARFLTTFRDTVTSIETALGEVENQLYETREALGLKATVPVNLVRQLEDSANRCQKLLGEKRVTLVRNWPFSTSLVWADAKVLAQLIDRALTLLATDATTESRLHIEISERTEPYPGVSLVLQNEGYGLPQRSLDSILEKAVTDLVSSGDPLEETMGMLKSLDHWGGQATASTTVGKGFRLQMDFLPLNLQDAPDHSPQGQVP